MRGVRPNDLMRRIQKDNLLDVALAEADRLNMTVTGNAIIGYRKQWEELERQLYSKPSELKKDPVL